MIAVSQGGVVGDEEGVLQRGLHHRMPSVHNGNLPAQGDLRAAVAPLDSHGGERAQRIRRGHGGGSLLHPGRLLGEVFPQLGENLVFQSGEPVLGGEHLVFQLLQLLGDVAFAVGQGLLADVVGGNLVHEGFGYLNIITKYPVEAHLQGADAGFLPLRGLDGRDGAGATLHDVPEPVGFRAGAPADDAALPDGQGRIVHQGVLDPVGAVRQSIHGLGKLHEHGGFHFGKLCLHLRQSPEAPGETQKIPGIDGSCDDSCHDPLQIRHIGKGLLQLSPDDHIVHQLAHGGVAAGNFSGIQQWLFQPGAEQPPAHGGSCFVQHPQKGALFLLGAHGFGEL